MSLIRKHRAVLQAWACLALVHVTFLREIALAQAILPIAAHFSVASSVCLSVVCHIRAPCLNRWTDLHAT